MIDPTITSSIIYGCLVGLECVGLTATYLTSKVPNFAVADFVVVGIYSSAASYILWRIPSPYYTIPLSVVMSGLVAVIMYLTVLRPLIRRGSSLVVLMIATLAVDIIFMGIFNLFVEYMAEHYTRILEDRGFGALFSSLQPLPDFKFMGYEGLLFVAPVALALLTLGLYLLFTRSKFGVAMRAAIENANLAKTVGINVELVNVVSWFLAGGISGLAGALFAIYTGTPSGASSLLIIEIFAGSVLGGLGSVYGAIIGGLIVGASETYLTAFLSRTFTVYFGASVGSEVLDFQKGIPLALMIIILLIAPQGLTGVNWRKVGGRIRRLSRSSANKQVESISAPKASETNPVMP